MSIELNQGVLNKLSALEESQKTLPLALTAGLGAIGTGFKIARDNNAGPSSGLTGDKISNLLQGAGGIANQLLGKE